MLNSLSLSLSHCLSLFLSANLQNWNGISADCHEKTVHSYNERKKHSLNHKDSGTWFLPQGKYTEGPQSTEITNLVFPKSSIWDTVEMINGNCCLSIKFHLCPCVTWITVACYLKYNKWIIFICVPAVHKCILWKQCALACLSLELLNVSDVLQSTLVFRQNCEKRLLAVLCLSVRPPTWTSRLQLDGFSWNFIFENFSKICPLSASFIQIW
jgi:hypothetical protein